MIYYLTYNEGFSGVYNSQVIDVVRHLKKLTNGKARLICFLPIGYSFKLFNENKAKIKSLEKDAIIIPSLPMQYGWKFSWIILSIALIFLKRGSFICREIYSTYLALKCKKLNLIKYVCHDGRGANKAQFDEYGVYSTKMSKTIEIIEPYSINNSDFNMAVSQSLVNYWKENFSYNKNNYYTIPCTLTEEFFYMKISDDLKAFYIKKYSISTNDLVLVFSGSSNEWQSFNLTKDFCELHLSMNSNAKVIFLTKENDTINKLKNTFPGRVYCDWVNINDVMAILSLCDYGLLLRENTKTNNVASPSKFAEYLAAGLKVIISDNLEFNTLVIENNCGYSLCNKSMVYQKLEKVNQNDKIKLKELVQLYFLKSSPINISKYKEIIHKLT